MITTVLEIKNPVHLLCEKTDNRISPYRLYLLYPGINKNNHSTEQKKLIAAYECMNSVLCHIYDMNKTGVLYRTYDIIISWSKKYYMKTQVIPVPVPAPD